MKQHESYNINHTRASFWPHTENVCRNGFEHFNYSVKNSTLWDMTLWKNNKRQDRVVFLPITPGPEVFNSSSIGAVHQLLQF